VCAVELRPEALFFSDTYASCQVSVCTCRCDRAPHAHLTPWMSIREIHTHAQTHTHTHTHAHTHTQFERAGTCKRLTIRGVDKFQDFSAQCIDKNGTAGANITQHCHRPRESPKCSDSLFPPPSVKSSSVTERVCVCAPVCYFYLWSSPFSFEMFLLLERFWKRFGCTASSRHFQGIGFLRLLVIRVLIHRVHLRLEPHAPRLAAVETIVYFKRVGVVH
jgi:hypothetical protein